MGSASTKDENSYSVQETVPIITKRTIGKLIVKYCGNEGQADDPTLYVTLRQMLQATITKLDTESAKTWKNAEIVIYDQQGNDFCICSGDAENKFVIQLNEKDEIVITCTDRKKKGISAWMRSGAKIPSNRAGSFTERSEPVAIENTKPATSPISQEDIEYKSQLN